MSWKTGALEKESEMNTINCILAAVFLILAGAFLSPADSKAIEAPGAGIDAEWKTGIRTHVAACDLNADLPI